MQTIAPATMQSKKEFYGKLPGSSAIFTLYRSKEGARHVCIEISALA